MPWKIKDETTTLARGVAEVLDQSNRQQAKAFVENGRNKWTTAIEAIPPNERERFLFSLIGYVDFDKVAEYLDLDDEDEKT